MKPMKGAQKGSGHVDCSRLGRCDFGGWWRHATEAAFRAGGGGLPLAAGGVAHGQPARGEPPGGGFTAEDYRPQDLTLLNFPEVRN